METMLLKYTSDEKREENNQSIYDSIPRRVIAFHKSKYAFQHDRSYELKHIGKDQKE
jgi:hypothetical protein